MAAHFTPGQGAFRVLRCATFAATSASLSVAAHAAAGGSLPDPVTATVITALLAGAGTALADRRRGSPTIVGAVTLGQLALHSFLQLSGSHQGRSHNALHSGTPFDPVSMVTGHLLVAVAVGLLLAHAERALFVVARLATIVLPVRPPPLLVVTAPRLLGTMPVPSIVTDPDRSWIRGPRGPPENSCTTRMARAEHGRSVAFSCSIRE